MLVNDYSCSLFIHVSSQSINYCEQTNCDFNNALVNAEININ